MLDQSPIGPNKTVSATAVPSFPWPSWPLLPRSFNLVSPTCRLFLACRPNSLCARLRNDNVANFQILIENQVDGIVCGGGF
jgi:hypothetical protein